MSLLNRNWLSQPPHDYELKQYKLFDAIQHLKRMIDNGEIHSALEEVEERLLYLYKFYNNKTKLEDDLKILKGINLDTMSLDYEYPKDLGDMSKMYEMCEFAIEEFESLFKLIRTTWRSQSKRINITEIPERRPTRESGYVFIFKKDSDEDILVYQYTPIISNTDWKTMEMTKITSLEKKEGALSTYIQSMDDNEKLRFWRIDHDLSTDNFEKGLLHIIRYNLFYKIVVS